MRTRTCVTVIWAAVAALLACLPSAAIAGGEECAREGEIHAVGGDVQAPRRLGGPAPEYPEEAKAEKIEGQVVLGLVIEKDGTVGSAEVLEPLVEALDRAAVEAIRQWTFEPATLEGEPVRVRYHVTVAFRLDGEGDPA